MMRGFGVGALVVLLAQAGALKLGEGSVAPPAKTAVPEQIHIAVAGRDAETGDATGMAVGWFTSGATTSSLVQFGPRPDALSTTARGAQHQYLEDWGYHHDVEVLGLTPGTQIYYRVGDGTTWSQIHRFTAAPSAASAAPFNVSIFGDMGYLGSDERPMVITIDDHLSQCYASATSIHRMEDSGKPRFIKSRTRTGAARGFQGWSNTSRC